MDFELNSRWLIALGAFVAVNALGYLIRAIILSRLARLFARTRTPIDDIVIVRVKRHFPIWSVLGGAVVAARIAPVPASVIATVDHVCSAAFSISLVIAVSRIATTWVDISAQSSESTLATTTLVRHTVRVIIIVIGSLFILSNLGISITPLLTALGIGSLAVALALQPTLSNFFAGLHLAFARPIRVGDFIEVETGAKGFVVDIGWRATRIREPQDNIIFIPNSRIVEMVLKNYSMPETEQAARVNVGVGYGSDLVKVERITIEVAKQTLAGVTGGVPTFEPFIRYNTFGASSIDFTVTLRVNNIGEQPLVIHEFLKRLKIRYDQEGIEIPFPQQVVQGRLAFIREGAGPRREETRTS